MGSGLNVLRAGLAWSKVGTARKPSCPLKGHEKRPLVSRSVFRAVLHGTERGQHGTEFATERTARNGGPHGGVENSVISTVIGRVRLKWNPQMRIVVSSGMDFPWCEQSSPRS